MNVVFFLLMSFPILGFAEGVLNVFLNGAEIPIEIIQTFEAETHIKVNFSTYDNNETMFAKLKASSANIYDLILPSNYYIERMVKLGMLNPLDPEKIPNLKYLDPKFKDPQYFSVPLVWGISGIFYNTDWIKNPPESWSDLWQKKWQNQLLLLDDPREVFSIALLSLGYSPNERNPKRIKEAYQHLLRLSPNIKLFAAEGIQSLLIDEETIIGQAWNGDLMKALPESKKIQFVYPKEGFLIWIDSLAMPRNPPHPNEAYQLINFFLEPRIAARLALQQGYPITNQLGRELLPQSLRDNPIAYPPEDILKHGIMQHDVGESAIHLYHQYWEALKLSF